MIVNEYNNEDLCLGIRNPRTDIRLYGYGTSELEQAMIAVTNLLWGFEFNSNFFRQGSAPKGMINFKGTIPEHQMKGFRRHWYQLLSGVHNAWKTPITNADEVQWVPLNEGPLDKQFGEWIDFMIKLLGAAYRTDPVEINFKYGNVGQRGALAEASNREKITESKERGLRPLLRFLEDCLNEHIIWPTNDNFQLEFVGLDAGTHEDTAKLNQMRVKTTRTIDELRAEDDLDPLPNGLGEIILDPTYLQWAQQKQAMEQGEQGIPGESPQIPQEGEEEQPEEAPNFDFASLFEEEEEEEESSDERSQRLSARAKAKAEQKAKAKTAMKSRLLTNNLKKSLIDIEI
jgi:hypothetical protein